MYKERVERLERLDKMLNDLSSLIGDSSSHHNYQKEIEEMQKYLDSIKDDFDCISLRIDDIKEVFNSHTTITVEDIEALTSDEIEYIARKLSESVMDDWWLALEDIATIVLESKNKLNNKQNG